MNELLREIDEELQAKRYATLAKKYAIYVVGTVLIVIVAFGGYELRKNQTAQHQAARAAAFATLAASPQTTAGDWLQFAEAGSDSFAVVALRFAVADSLRRGDNATASQIMQKLAEESPADYKALADIMGQIAAINAGEQPPPLQTTNDDGGEGGAFAPFAVLAETERLLRQGDNQAAVALLESQLGNENSPHRTLFFELANAIKSVNQ